MTHALSAQRRARVASQIGPDGIALIPTAPERPRNRDSDFLFRHDSYFYYLTGFTEPNAWLLITATAGARCSAPPGQRSRDLGRLQAGPEAARSVAGTRRCP